MGGADPHLGRLWREVKAMLTAVYSLNQVYGAEIWVVFAGGCAAVYLAVCCLFRRNRRKRGIGVALLGLLRSEEHTSELQSR